ncbi:MAG: hypothetical protein JWN06_1458 [Propionibacteriaceae bacterium]|jgi:hypothetical protein|nr:hypothetical protein [Propionibacteriaceae bacterium]
MAVLLLTSAAGAPGVTTLSIGLALTWPRAVIVADCDPAAPQAVLAGYLQGRCRTSKGLLRVAEAHRDRRPLAEVVMDQTVELAEDPEHRRLLLPGFSKPGSARLFSAGWADLADAFARFDEAGIDVIVDAGRIGPDGVPFPLLERCQAVGMVSRTSLRAVAATRVHAATLIEQCRLAATDVRAGLILVGEGEPYSGREISGLIDLPVLGTVAADPIHAACLSDGAPRPRKFDASPLVRTLRSAAAHLSSSVDRSAGRVGTTV